MVQIVTWKSKSAWLYLVVALLFMFGASGESYARSCSDSGTFPYLDDHCTDHAPNATNSSLIPPGGARSDGTPSAMPYVANINFRICGSLGCSIPTEPNGPVQRSFFIHQQECLGVIGASELLQDGSNWPNVTILNGQQSRRYIAFDNMGQSGACYSGPIDSTLERLYLTRSGVYPDQATYRVESDDCWTRRNLTWEEGDYQGVCSNINDYDDPSHGKWHNNRLANFGYLDLAGTFANFFNFTNGETVKTLNSGVGPGYEVALIRILPGGDPIANMGGGASSFTNNTKYNQICGFRWAGGAPFPLLNYGSVEAFFGCVNEPPLPPPNVFNPVVTGYLSPTVLTNLCMDASQPGGCDQTQETLVARGSTFDKPMIVLSTGLGATNSPCLDASSPCTKPNPSIMQLQYQFQGDVNPAITTCAAFNVPGFDKNIQYCAQVDPNNPGQVCACERGNSGQNPPANGTINPSVLYGDSFFDYCGSNPYLGCVNRPTLQHSNLMLIPQYVGLTDTVRGWPIPSVAPLFVGIIPGSYTATSNGIIAYVDSKGDNACLNQGDNNYYVCSATYTPTTTPSVFPLNYAKQLALPIMTTTPSFSIKEFYLNDTFQGTGCVDSVGNSVYFGYDLNFYLFQNGVLNTSLPANGTVTCIMPGNATPVTIAPGPSDSLLPNDVEQDNAYIYGLDIEAMIPVINSDNTIDFERYTTPMQSQLPLSNCVPYSLTDLCDALGTTMFVPAGQRNTQLCPVVAPVDLNPGTSNAPNPCLGPPYASMGQNDPNALTLLCPGIYTVTNNSAVDSICLWPQAIWPYDTIANYNTTIANSISGATTSTCNTPVPNTLCVGIGSPCSVINSLEFASDLALWPAMVNSVNPKYSTCDPSMGLQPAQSVTVGPLGSFQTQFCSILNIPAASCASTYATYMSGSGWANLQTAVKTMLTNLWAPPTTSTSGLPTSYPSNYTQANINTMLATLDTNTQGLFNAIYANPATYSGIITTGASNPQRFCQNNSSTYQYPCMVSDPCLKDVSANSGNALWLVNNITAQNSDLTNQLVTPALNKVSSSTTLPSTIPITVTGLCSTGYVQAPSGPPTKTCNVYLDQNKIPVYAWWNSDTVTNPCIVQTAPNVTVTNNCTAFSTATTTFPAATVPTPTPTSNTTIQVSSTSCQGGYVTAGSAPTAACNVTVATSGNNTAVTLNWASPAVVTNQCVSANSAAGICHGQNMINYGYCYYGWFGAAAAVVYQNMAETTSVLDALVGATYINSYCYTVCQANSNSATVPSYMKASLVQPFAPTATCSASTVVNGVQTYTCN
ncbi:MAG: hypothetical protein ACHP6I_00695 [Rickettsiales bacterium]